MRSSIRNFVLLLIVVTTLGVSAEVRVKDPGDTGGGGGSGSCTYCSQSRCGCASAPLGYRLDYSCSCSSIDCNRSCDYTPI